MRRLDWVRVVVGRQGAHAHAVGSTHRLPRTVPIPVDLAAELAAGGVPLVLRCMDGTTAGKGSG